MSDLAAWTMRYQIAPYTVAAHQCDDVPYGDADGKVQADDVVVAATTGYAAPQGIAVYGAVAKYGAELYGKIVLCNNTGADITIPFPFTPTLYGVRP